jgi:hypothetical protein
MISQFGAAKRVLGDKSYGMDERNLARWLEDRGLIGERKSLMRARGRAYRFSVCDRRQGHTTPSRERKRSVPQQ